MTSSIWSSSMTGENGLAIDRSYMVGGRSVAGVENFPPNPIDLGPSFLVTGASTSTSAKAGDSESVSVSMLGWVSRETVARDCMGREGGGRAMVVYVCRMVEGRGVVGVAAWGDGVRR
jgi:hypothetical protein